jgi:hypothetical protein
MAKWAIQSTNLQCAKERLWQYLLQKLPQHHALNFLESMPLPVLLVLLAYSSACNPIESIRHQIKHHIRHNTNKTLDFWHKVDDAFCSL